MRTTMSSKPKATTSNTTLGMETSIWQPSLLTLNLLAFLFHTVLDLLDAKYKCWRTELRVRKTFFDDLRALTRYMYLRVGNICWIS